MIDPVTKAQQLFRDLAPLLDDGGEGGDELSLNRWIRQARAALVGTDREGFRMMWVLIGLASQRLYVVEKPANIQRLEQAYEAFLKVHRVEPTDPHAAIKVGRALAYLSREREALSYFELAERRSRPGEEAHSVALLNQAAAYHFLNDPERADDFLYRLIEQTPPRDVRGLLRAAYSAAVLDHEEDSVELLARALCATQDAVRGDRPSVEVLGSAPEEFLKVALKHESVERAYRNVSQRWSQPVPPDVVLPARVTLSADAWFRFAELADLPARMTPA